MAHTCKYYVLFSIDSIILIIRSRTKIDNIDYSHYDLKIKIFERCVVFIILLNNLNVGAQIYTVDSGYTM